MKQTVIYLNILQTCTSRHVSYDMLHVHPGTHTNWFDMSVNVMQDEPTKCDKQIEFECVFSIQGEKTGYEHTWCTHPPARTHTNMNPH